MASPEATLAGLTAIVVFLFCCLCFKLKPKNDERVAQPTPQPRKTSLRPTTQRINARGSVTNELTTQHKPGDIPIIVRKPSPIGWSRSRTLDSHIPNSPTRRLKGSLAGNSNNRRSCPYPIENPTTSDLPFSSFFRKNSAPYPVQSPSNERKPYFPTVTTTSAPYPIESMPYPAEYTQSSAHYPVHNYGLTAQMPYPPYPYVNIHSDDPEEKEKLPHSYKVIQNITPYPIVEPLEGLLPNDSTLVEPSAPPAQDNTKKILQYPLEIGQNSAPYPLDEPLNKKMPFPAEVNSSFLNNQGMPQSNKKIGNLDRIVSMRYMDEKMESEEKIRLLEPNEQSQPQTADPEKCLADDRRPDTNISEENDQKVDISRIGFIRPPEPGFIVASMSGGPTTSAVGSYGASGCHGLSSGSMKKLK